MIQYRKLNLSEGHSFVLSEEEARQDMSTLLDRGYDMSTIRELFAYDEGRIQLHPQQFIILRHSDLHPAVEDLIRNLAQRKMTVILYLAGAYQNASVSPR